MHNHNKKNSSITWMMLICIVPLVVLLFVGGELSSGGYLWPILIGVFVAAHLWMMFKGHGGHGDANTGEKSDLPVEAASFADLRFAEGSGEARVTTKAESAQAGATSKQPEAKSEHKKGGCCH